MLLFLGSTPSESPMQRILCCIIHLCRRLDIRSTYRTLYYLDPCHWPLSLLRQRWGLQQCEFPLFCDHHNIVQVLFGPSWLFKQILKCRYIFPTSTTCSSPVCLALGQFRLIFVPTISLSASIRTDSAVTFLPKKAMPFPIVSTLADHILFGVIAINLQNLGLVFRGCPLCSFQARISLPQTGMFLYAGV